VSISRQAIEAVAPDQSALSAAAKIKAPSWNSIGQDRARNLAWGECQGSGSAPYRVALDLNELVSKCTCPSRKFPCKHGLSLMLILLDRPEVFTADTAPDWVEDWMARRRPAAKPNTDRPAVSLDAAHEEAQRVPDEKDAAKAAAQRERLRAQREQSILDGLDELDRWIADQLDKGLATFAQRAAQQCRLAAQRLVDAKAPALATRLDSMPSELLALPEAQRGLRAMEMLGSLHLLAAAYRRQDKVPDGLREDIRRLVGWTIERQDLLQHPLAETVSATWLVLAVRSEIQPDKLKRIETWFMSLDLEPVRFALLVDFVPLAVSRSGGSPYIPGEAFMAELAYYPSATPLLAALVTRGDSRPADWPRATSSLNEALIAHDTLVATNPWVSSWPALVSGIEVTGSAAHPVIADGEIAVPVAVKSREGVLGLAAADIVALVGLWDGRSLTPMAATTSLGHWFGT
jgi:hypothetical protein